MNKYSELPSEHCNVFLIGAGIMSATLGTLLNELQPDWKIVISERQLHGAEESSAALNNAGTGHAGYCELNYTPMDINGDIDTTKAIKVNKSFAKSKELWDYLITHNGLINNFYTTTPHISFVHGQENVDYLRKRYDALIKNEAFRDMSFTTNIKTLEAWMPLVMKGRNSSEPIAATMMEDGLDVDFGNLTKNLLTSLRFKGVIFNYNHEVIDLYKENGKWNVIEKARFSGNITRTETDFLFIGAGGASITLLEKSRIPEAKGYGGFPVSGQWLICDNPEIVEQHDAKVYGKPSVGAPPMSVPHLDTRTINGKKCLLFGPYAGFSTKFLKKGSWMDFFKSIRLSNIGVMLDAGARNLPLTKYLMSELFKGPKARFKVLQDYYPNAKQEDWKLAVAGQRVQVIKKENGKGVIEFGTEIVSSADGSLACLLGASPGASTSVKAMLDVIDTCFKDKSYYSTWKYKLEEMIPTYKNISK